MLQGEGLGVDEGAEPLLPPLCEDGEPEVDHGSTDLETPAGEVLAGSGSGDEVDLTAAGSDERFSVEDARHAEDSGDASGSGFREGEEAGREGGGEEEEEVGGEDWQEEAGGMAAALGVRDGDHCVQGDGEGRDEDEGVERGGMEEEQEVKDVKEVEDVGDDSEEGEEDEEEGEYEEEEEEGEYEEDEEEEHDEEEDEEEEEEYPEDCDEEEEKEEGEPGEGRVEGVEVGDAGGAAIEIADSSDEVVI